MWDGVGKRIKRGVCMVKNLSGTLSIDYQSRNQIFRWFLIKPREYLKLAKRTKQQSGSTLQISGFTFDLFINLFTKRRDVAIWQGLLSDVLSRSSFQKESPLRPVAVLLLLGGGACVAFVAYCAVRLLTSPQLWRRFSGGRGGGNRRSANISTATPTITTTTRNRSRQQQSTPILSWMWSSVSTLMESVMQSYIPVSSPSPPR